MTAEAGSTAENAMLSDMLKYWPQISATIGIIAVAAINAMTKPEPASTPRYIFWFNFLHNLPLPTYTHSSNAPSNAPNKPEPKETPNDSQP